MLDAPALYDERYRRGYRTELQGYEAARARAIGHALRGHARPMGARRVLDYGCGNGLFHATIREALPGIALSGCDVSAEALAQIERMDPSVHTELIRDDRSAFDDDSFDCITCIEVLEHVAHPDRTLREIARVLRPGGLLVATTPCANAGSLEHLVASVTRRIDRSSTGERRWRWEDPTHLRRYTGAELRRDLHDSGFDRVRLRYRAHAMSYLCTPLCAGGRPSWCVRGGEWLMSLEYRLLRWLPCAASMVVIARLGARP